MVADFVIQEFVVVVHFGIQEFVVVVHFGIQEFVTVESGCPTHQPLLHQGQLWLQTNPEL